MRFSLTNTMALSWLEALSAARMAEACGFEEYLVSDHLQAVMGFDDEKGCLDGPTLLGALAASTATLGLGIMVSPVTWRHPVLLARALQTVDLISGGRVVTGLGLGWDPAEHRRFGFDFPPLKVRRDLLDEACRIIRSLWAEALVPRPSRQPAPILIGGASRESIELAARHAVRWNAVGSPAFVGERVGMLRAAEAAAGRTDPPVEVTVSRIAVFVDDPADFSFPASVADGPQPQRSYTLPGEETRAMYVGPADAFAGEIAEFEAAGVDRIVLPVSSPVDERQIETLARACGLI